MHTPISSGRPRSTHTHTHTRVPACLLTAALCLVPMYPRRASLLQRPNVARHSCHTVLHVIVSLSAPPTLHTPALDCILAFHLSHSEHSLREFTNTLSVFNVRVLHVLIWVRASALTRARILPSSNVIARHDAFLAVRAGVHSVAPCVCGSFLCAR